MTYQFIHGDAVVDNNLSAKRGITSGAPSTTSDQFAEALKERVKPIESPIHRSKEWIMGLSHAL